MARIEVKNLTFAYQNSTDNVFENVSFSVDTDWKLGFTGRNGRGKTTFLKILNNELDFSGSIVSTVKTTYFPFQTNEGFSVKEVIKDIAGEDIQDWQMERELKLMSANISIFDIYGFLSKGEKTKVMLSAMFLKENSFLLIDEPTDNLDTVGRKAVARYLNSKKGFIVVSHDLNFLDECTDHTLSINKNGIEVIKGNFSTYLNVRDGRDKEQLQKNKHLEQDISRLKSAAIRAKSFSDKAEKAKFASGNGGEKPPDRGFAGHKAAKLMQLSKNIISRIDNAIEEKSLLFKDVERASALKIASKPFAKERLVYLKDVSIFYDKKVAVKSICLEVLSGELVAIAGGNGSGKTSIIKLIMGENISFTGEVQVAKSLEISLIRQDTSTLQGGLKAFCEGEGIDESLFKAILNKLSFEQKDFDSDMQSLSQGQKKKVLLAASLSKPAHLYIWDEPLNYIDYYSRIQIEELIKQSNITLLFVEHDSGFCESVATKIINLD